MIAQTVWGTAAIVSQDEYLQSKLELLRSCGSQTASVAVLSDFDGTISVRDVQVGILDAFARSDWREVEGSFLRQGLKSYSALPAVYEGCTASQEQVVGFVDKYAAIDPSFGEFALICRSQGWHLEVVSDGLSVYIERLLDKAKLRLPFFSNRAQFTGHGVVLDHPNYNPECGRCGSCKLARVREARQRGAKCVVYLGDGVSDECVARHVDLLFAKDSLERYCLAEAIPYVHFSTFADVIEHLEHLAVPLH